MDAFNFREGLCFVSIAPEDYAQKLAAESQEILYPDHLGFIDTTGQFRVGPFSNKWWIRSFQEGLSLVRDEWNKHGYIDVSGEWVIPPKYEYASPFYGGIAQASYYEGNKLRVCLIDRKGKEIYSFIR